MKSEQGSTESQTTEPSQGPAKTASVPGVTPPVDALRVLADALKTGDPGEQPSVVVKREKGKAPKNLESLAAELELDLPALYDIEIPSSREGEAPYTFGKLKDLAADRDNFAIQNLQRDNEFNRQQSELIAAQNELDAFVSSIPKELLKPEVLNQFREKYQRNLAQERTRTLEMISEWRDPVVRAREMQAMVEYMGENGFPAHFLTHVHDSRMIRFIRNNWRRETALKAALEKVKEVKPTTPPKPKAAAPQKPKLVTSTGNPGMAAMTAALFGNKS